MAGWVAAVGAGVAGRRVLVDTTLYASEGNGLVGARLVGSERNGGFAEYVAVPAENAHAVESVLKDEQFATFLPRRAHRPASVIRAETQQAVAEAQRGLGKRVPLPVEVGLDEHPGEPVQRRVHLHRN